MSEGTMMKTNQYQVEMVRIADIKLPARQVRKHPPGQIRKLMDGIEAFGFLVPIVIGDGDQIAAGRARLEAARRLGWDEVPAIRATHLLKGELRAFALADNRIAEDASWDMGALRLELQEISIETPTLELGLTGFSIPEIDKLFAHDEGGDEAGLEESDVPVGKPVSRPGDIWRLGEHRIICGDACKPETFTDLLAGEEVQMVLQDAPFNVKIGGHVSGLGGVAHREFAMASGEMSDDEFTAFLAANLGALLPHLADGSLLYQFMDWRHLSHLERANRTLDLLPQNCAVWVKDRWLNPYAGEPSASCRSRTLQSQVCGPQPRGTVNFDCALRTKLVGRAKVGGRAHSGREWHPRRSRRHRLGLGSRVGTALVVEYRSKGTS
jgi:hypothetical protein